MERHAARPHHARAALALAAAVSLLAIAPNAHAADPMGPTLCAVLKQLLPQVKTYRPEGARAQLVMAIAEKYDSDATQLRQVRAQIDRTTSASCPKEREAMLDIVKTKSLAEAVS